MDETAAINLCLHERDPRGFEFLVEKYRKEALFHAFSFLGNQQDAADACQESFTKAFMAIPGLTQLDLFYPWFYRILRNCCLNVLRQRKTSKKYTDQVSLQKSASEGLIPKDVLEEQDEQLKVWAVLDSLTVNFREILVMKYIESLRYDEIAKLLSIPRGSVMSRLYQARKAFRTRYLKGLKA